MTQTRFFSEKKYLAPSQLADLKEKNVEAV